MRIARSGGIVSTGLNDSYGDTEHLVANVTGEHLDGVIRTGMMQFSGDANRTRFATFERTNLSASTGPDIACVEGSAMMGNSALVINGKHMDSVTGISILGERAAILSQGSRSLEVQPGSAPLSGVSYGQIELSHADSKKLCLDFSASPPDGPRFTSREIRDGTIEISIPRADWQPGQAYSVDATVFMPWLDGVSRGSRALQMSFRAPTGARDAYAHGLEALAAAITSAMNGGFTPNPSNPCDCEVEVEPSPLAEKLILAPCLPPPPKPEPAVPGPDDLKKPNPIIVGGIIVKAKNPPPVECDGEYINHKDGARVAAWCHFEKIVQPVVEDTYNPVFEPYIGHPLFASWKPLQMVMDTPYGGMNEPWILDPDSQPTGMKDILFDYETVSQMRVMEYNDPHTWALRGDECLSFEKIWTPKISSGNRIVKTFFVAGSMVPSSINLEGLYSYIPPNKQERHYLLGLHVAISTLHDFGDEAQGQGYFWWASFWVPAGDGDTETRSGQDLEWTYSPTCTVGNGDDRPVDLPQPLDRFVMCTDADPNEGPCGNPYAFGECPLDGTTTSCAGCHSDMGRRSLDGKDALRIGWLPSLSLALNESELDIVVAETRDNPADYTWWTEPTLYDDDPKVPVSCLLSSPGVWNPFDPNDEPPDEGEP